ncbi:MAG: type II toxin-antitoxin system VapC family toxin [Pseudolysinimonas sp.]
MILDASAIVAILEEAHDFLPLVSRLSRSTTNRISAASYFETSIVIDARRNPVLSGRFDELLGTHKVTIEPVTEGQARIARQAYRDYGRGSGHPAALNFGDCFAYALAKDFAEPLLYKGDDFAHTDIRSALG